MVKLQIDLLKDSKTGPNLKVFGSLFDQKWSKNSLNLKKGGFLLKFGIFFYLFGLKSRWKDSLLNFLLNHEAQFNSYELDQNDDL